MCAAHLTFAQQQPLKRTRGPNRCTQAGRSNATHAPSFIVRSGSGYGALPAAVPMLRTGCRERTGRSRDVPALRHSHRREACGNEPRHRSLGRPNASLTTQPPIGSARRHPAPHLDFSGMGAGLRTRQPGASTGPAQPSRQPPLPRGFPSSGTSAARDRVRPGRPALSSEPPQQLDQTPSEETRPGDNHEQHGNQDRGRAKAGEQALPQTVSPFRPLWAKLVFTGQIHRLNPRSQVETQPPVLNAADSGIAYMLGKCTSGLPLFRFRHAEVS